MVKSQARIVLVDDEQAVRQSLRRLLRSVGLNAETFASPQEFLQSLEQSNRPDCVILDLHLPGMSGLEVQAELGRSHPTLPVIVVTGRDDPGLSERVFAAGAVAYLKKPFDEQALLGAIESAVNGRDASQRDAELSTRVLTNKP